MAAYNYPLREKEIRIKSQSISDHPNRHEITTDKYEK
jgi:hypothetical protein